MKILFSAICIITAAWGAHGQSTEAMLDYTATTPAGGNPVYSTIYSSINGPVGWTFQPLENMDVTALGAFSYIMPGNGNLIIGLWNSSGTLLASQSVNAASSPVGESLYTAIAPVLLTAGQTYYLAAFDVNGPMSAVVVTPDEAPNGFATMSPEIDLGLVAYKSNSSFMFPVTTDGDIGDAIIAPNFEFQPVPEPSEFFLLAGGITVLVLKRRGKIVAQASRRHSMTA